MKSHYVQAALARKRENEQIRTERTNAVDRYYVHWGKQLSKYENWTTPEYYKQAEDKLKQSKEKKEKEEKLNERREKLRKLLDSEKLLYAEELKNLSRKPRSRNLSSDVMEKIDRNFKDQQNERRRLELEAKLYGRLRHGKDDGNLLYESKSDHQVLAKLNWLDKQIEDQVRREQDEKEAMERSLRMQEEIRKTEETHKHRQEIREKEIREIRALQDRHVSELREREYEAESLKSEANDLETAIEKINNEETSLENNDNPFLEKRLVSNNLRNIKSLLRKRAEEFRTCHGSFIELLSRIDEICPNDPSIKQKIKNFNQQLKSERQNLSEVDGMYESEAKVNLQQCEEVWRRLVYDRKLELLDLLQDVKSQLRSKMHENQMRQKDLIKIRSTHLMSIENSNEQLNRIIEENHLESPRPLVVAPPKINKDQDIKEPVHTHYSDSFANLNLDCLSGDGSQPTSARSNKTDTESTTSGPRFGRKKIAWD